MPGSTRRHALSFDESVRFGAPAAFGAYRVLHQTGSGILGPVFRAYDASADRLIAIKAFKLDLIPEDVARLAASLRQLAAIPTPDPHLVSLVGAGLEGTTAFLAMEYLTGETLDIALRQWTPLPISRALPLLARLASAVDACWRAGVGHGALHPRDVFVSALGDEIRLTGWGAVRAIENASLVAPARRPYAPPERIAGQTWDARADVYGLAAIAHELLTRRRPAGPGEQDGVFGPDVSPAARVHLRRVLARALSAKPSQRFASGAEFFDALASAARSEPAGVLPFEAEPETPAEAIEVEAVAIAAPEPVAIVAPEPVAVVEPEPVAVVALEPVAVVEPEPVAMVAEPETLLDVPPAVLLAPVVEPAAPIAQEPVHVFEAPVQPTDRVWLDRAEQYAATHMISTPRPKRSVPALASIVTIAAAAVLGVGLGVWAVYGWVSRAETGSAKTPTVARVTAPPSPTSSSAAPAASVARPAQPATATPSDTEVAVAVDDPPRDAAPRPTPASDARRVSAPAGRLVVRSTPSGAMVTLDGRIIGETPLSAGSLPLGTHSLLIARPGFAPHAESLTLSATTPSRTVIVELEAGVRSIDRVVPSSGGSLPSAATRGALDVDTRPRGARVIIDGRYAGTTPLRVPELSIGLHTVTLELAGYKSLTTRTAVEAGKAVPVKVTLELQGRR